ncbi:MAG: phytanoyl-CoA dioxygenase family protein [Chitinophagales bacterium]|nr:phytanoyl-CoA dioxygenase family protein [Chitinophagales bacterium]
MKVIENRVIRSDSLRESIKETGYAIAGNIGSHTVQSIRLLYDSLHQFTNKDGGMFYSLYSDDIEYRKGVHSGIFDILKPVYDSYFNNYKTVINSFIVKTPGKGSDFSLHQDSTGLDESMWSPLSVWIPLQDTELTNGTLCVVPKSHKFFHPYRGISFASPFANYENLVRRYLLPINLNAGDILLFDNRLVHYSHLNLSHSPRVVVMSGIFPSEAKILSVYKDESVPNSPIEIYLQDDDFLITNKAFYKDCTARPYRGEVVRKIYDPLPDISMYDFMSIAANHDVLQTNIPELMNPLHQMQIISEPV